MGIHMFIAMIVNLQLSPLHQFSDAINQSCLIINCTSHPGHERFLRQKGFRTKVVIRDSTECFSCLALSLKQGEYPYESDSHSATHQR